MFGRLVISIMLILIYVESVKGNEKRKKLIIICIIYENLFWLEYE